MYNLNYTPTTIWGYKVEEKLYLGVREQKRLNTTGVDCQIMIIGLLSLSLSLSLVIHADLLETSQAAEFEFTVCSSPHTWSPGPELEVHI
jgi:hypothetical protein